ncbi:MAG: hypothetical protein SGBAC_011895 [Bacillariaceae sp.]
MSRPTVPGAVSESNEEEEVNESSYTAGRDSRRRRKEKEAVKSLGLPVRQKGGPKTKKDGLEECMSIAPNNNIGSGMPLEVVPEATIVQNDENDDDDPQKEIAVQGNIVVMPSGTAQPSESSSVALIATAQEDSNKSSSSSQAKKPFYTSPKFWALILVILGGAGAGIYALTSSNNASEQVVLTAGETSTDLPTSPPTTSNPSGLPSNSPTEVLEVKPPLPEDCMAVAKGEPVEVRQDLIRNLEVPMDVLLTVSADSEVVASQLQQAIQEYLAPEMMGCDLILERRNMVRGSADSRNLQLSDLSQGF